MNILNFNRKLVRLSSLLLLTISCSILPSMVKAANYNLTEEQSLNEPGVNFDFSNKLFLSQEDQVNRKKNEQYLAIYKLIKEKKITQADNLLEKVLVQYPQEVAFINLAGMIKATQNKLSEAKLHFQSSLKIDQNNLMATLGLAKLALKKNEFNEAKKYAENAKKNNQKSIKAYFVLAEIAIKQKNIQDAEKILLKGLSINQGNIKQEIAIIAGLRKIYAINKQHDKTVTISKDLVIRYPGNVMALSTLAVAHLMNDQTDLAEKTLKQVVQKKPNDIRHRVMLVNMMGKQKGRKIEFNRLLDEILTIEPNNLYAMEMKVSEQIKSKNYTNAKQAIANISLNYPDLAIGKNLKGDLLVAQQKYDAALSTYEAAYAVKSNAKTMNKIIYLMTRLKQTEKAKVFLEKELEKNNHPLIHFNLANIYQQQKKYKLAEKHYSSILTTQPDNFLAMNNLAWNLLQQKKTAQALQWANKAYQKKPESPAVLDTYGYILAKDGKSQQAESILKKAVELAPKNYDIKAHLAEVYMNNNKNNEALTLLKGILLDEYNFSEKQVATELYKKLSQ